MALDICFDRKQFLEKTCRACSRYFDSEANDENNTFCPIFEKVGEQDEKPRPNEAIKDIFDDINIWKLNIKPFDGLPQQFCFECVSRFRSVKLFREECLDTQKVLESYFKDFDTLLETVSNGKLSPKTESVKSEPGIPGSPSSFQDEDFINDIAKTSNPVQQISPIGSPRFRYSPKLNDLLHSERFTGTPPPLFEEIKTEPIDMQTMEYMKAESDLPLDTATKKERHSDENRELAFEPLRKSPPQHFNTSDDESSTPTSDEEDNSSETDSDSQSKYRHESRANSPFNRSKSLQCNICWLSFSSRNLLNDHRLRAHPQEKPYACDVCDKCFKSKFLLSQHKHKHNRLDSIKCELCPKYFRSQLHLQRHAKNFHLTSTYTCHICHEKFENYTQMRFQYHVRQHGEKRFRCQYCEKSFHQKIHLINHERTHTKEQPFRCNICGKCYRQQTACQEHMLTHQDPTPFKCEICLKGFTQRSSLRLHYRTHSLNKPFQCEYCGQKFAQKVRYNIHVATHLSTAGTVEKFTCQFCKMSFTNEARRTAHIQTVHANARLHSCGHCGKTFALEATFKAHIRTHVTSPKNLKCQYCDKTFQQQEMLRLHEQQHNDQPERFECSFCEKTFLYRSTFDKHILTHLESDTGEDDPMG